MATYNPRHAFSVLALLLLSALPAWSAYTPPQALDSAAAGIQLDSSFQSDAWLVCTYDIDATIQRSNGVLEVEQAVLQQLASIGRVSPPPLWTSRITACSM